MTDKRFTSNNGVFYTDNETGWEFQCYGEVVDLLNDLHEENTQLKQQLEDCRDANTRCCNEYSFFHKEMMKAEKENTRIKTTIDEAIRTERTQIGKSVLKQLKEAIQ